MRVLGSQGVSVAPNPKTLIPENTTTLSHPIIVILGPTASGKSALGVSLARRFNGVIVSADSRQVYRGYDLGSGKVTRREMRGVPHYLLNVASPRRQYTAGDFARDFQRVLRRIPRRKPVFLVGGSPFYIEAALNPERLANVKPNPALRRRRERLTTAALIRELERKDPDRAATIDRSNRRRLIRAIEIARASSTTTLHPRPYTLDPLRVIKLGLSLPRPILYQRIDRRVDERLRRGMVKEIARLHERGVSWQRLESLGLEARFLTQHLRGHLTREAAITRLKGAIHAFARRQLTWWRRDRSMHWIHSAAEAERLIQRFLQRRNN